MKIKILNIGFICLFLFCCGKKLNENKAADVIQESYGINEGETLEILGISMESRDVALVKIMLNKVQILSRMRIYDTGWQLDEIQNEFGIWMPGESVINKYKEQKTKEEIESLGNAITKLIRDNLGIRSPKRLEILVPSYLNSVPLYDKWGNEYRIKFINSEPIPISNNVELFMIGVDEYFILSAGSDKRFYTEDDIIWSYGGYWRFDDFKGFLY